MGKYRPIWSRCLWLLFVSHCSTFSRLFFSLLPTQPDWLTVLLSQSLQMMKLLYSPRLARLFTLIDKMTILLFYSFSQLLMWCCCYGGCKYRYWHWLLLLWVLLLRYIIGSTYLQCRWCWQRQSGNNVDSVDYADANVEVPIPRCCN